MVYESDDSLEVLELQILKLDLDDYSSSRSPSPRQISHDVTTKQDRDLLAKKNNQHNSKERKSKKKRKSKSRFGKHHRRSKSRKTKKTILNVDGVEVQLFTIKESQRVIDLAIARVPEEIETTPAANEVTKGSKKKDKHYNDHVTKLTSSPSKKKKRRHRKKHKNSGHDIVNDKDCIFSQKNQKSALQPQEQHFYPPPDNIVKKRSPGLFKSDGKPIKCTICDSFHYRTKRNFASNLKIIISVNKAVTGRLNDMRKGMRRIDNNLVEVKKNLEFMEELYDKVFRKVNRLLVDDEQAKNLIPDS